MSRYGLHRVQALWPFAAAGLLLVVLPSVARADNRGSILDCFGSAGAAVVTALGAGLATALHFFRGGYPDLPPNLAGPGQYGPYGNPATGTDHQGVPYSGRYIGTRGDGTVGPVTPGHFTDPATGKDYVNSSGAMVYFSQGLHEGATAIIGTDGTPSPTDVAGKA